jgi:hypothetical protein
MGVIGMVMVAAFTYMIYDIGRVYAEKRAERKGE